jgi:hypothetical protein
MFTPSLYPAHAFETNALTTFTARVLVLPSRGAMYVRADRDRGDEHHHG